MLYKAFISYSHAADARLAPVLRSALRRIGVPWYRPTPFRIFLDESSLSASPALWNTIEEALEHSEYLLLLASTNSARSEWVVRELDWWLSHRKAATVLILITDGDVEWSSADRDFNWERTTAINPRLRGQFHDEPLWVDLRWARNQRKFSLRRPEFRNAVLQVAPPLYGRSREDLDDTDTRHYRAARRMAAFAICLLAVLAIGVGYAARAARRQRELAECRELAGQAIGYLDTRLDLALLLGVESSRRLSCVEGRSALLTALQYRPHFAGFLAGHSATVTTVAYAPGGSILASSSWDRTVRLWDVVKRKTLGPPLRGMYGLSFTPDGAMLASADGKSISLWKIPDGTLSGELPFDRRYSITRISFSPDGKTLAGSNDPTGRLRPEVFLWDVATRQLLGPGFPGHIFAFRPDGKVVATDGGDGNSIVLRDIATRGPVGPPLTGHTGQLRSIAFSADGRTLAAGGADNSVMVWDLQAGQSDGKALTGHRAAVNAVAFSPEGTVLASGSGDGSVILWDVESLQPIGLPLTVAGKPVFDVAFSPDGRALVCNSEERLVLWDVTDGLPIGHTVPIPEEKNSGLVFSPDGKEMASINPDGEVTLSDADSGRTLHDSIDIKVTSAAFSPDNTLLASVSRDGRFALWDRATGEPKGPAEETGFRLFSVTFSPDGGRIAIGGDSVLLLWDTKAMMWVARIDGQQKDRIWSVAFSPDGSLLASGGNSSIGLWDSRTGSAVIAPLETDPNAKYLLPTNVAFSPDGKLLAYRQGRTGVVLWEIAHRRQDGQALSGHKRTVTALAFSPEGKTMATGGGDGVLLWDLTSRAPLGRPFVGMGTTVESLAFRPNGQALATLGDKRLLLFDVREASWRETACKLANRNLTHDEWIHVFGPAATYRETCSTRSFVTAK